MALSFPLTRPGPLRHTSCIVLSPRTVLGGRLASQSAARAFCRWLQAGCSLGESSYSCPALQNLSRVLKCQLKFPFVKSFWNVPSPSSEFLRCLCVLLFKMWFSYFSNHIINTQKNVFYTGSTIGLGNEDLNKCLCVGGHRSGFRVEVVSHCAHKTDPFPSGAGVWLGADPAAAAAGIWAGQGDSFGS